MNGSKHKSKSPPSEGGQKTLSFDPSQNSEEIKTGQAKTAVSFSNKKQSTISGSITKENVVRAKIIWALEILNCSCSLNSCAKKGKLFSVMFPDSNVAQNFQMASTKASYVTYYGLAPYFKEMLLDELKKASYIVPCFHESYNSVIKKGQVVRYWGVRLNKVNTRYVKSEFMGKAAAIDVLAKFEAASSELDRTKFIQMSSDGPNVDLKFLELLCEKRQDEDLKKLIFIGTCGLHTVSRAFQNAEQSTDWNVKKILMDMHKIL